MGSDGLNRDGGKNGRKEEEREVRNGEVEEEKQEDRNLVRDEGQGEKLTKNCQK